MNSKSIKYLISSIFLVFILGGCIQSDYTKLVKRELGKGVRVDSVVFGIGFGDTRNEYYGKCFDLNRQHLVTAGPDGASVQYLFEDTTVHDSITSVRLLFKPEFDNKDKIIAIDLVFSYPSWAPWNAKYQSDKLREKVLLLLMKWYKGNDFITAKIEGQDLPVKVDGNRRMIVFVRDERNVVVRVHDLLNEKYRHSITSYSKKEKKD